MLLRHHYFDLNWSHIDINLYVRHMCFIDSCWCLHMEKPLKIFTQTYAMQKEPDISRNIWQSNMASWKIRCLCYLKMISKLFWYGLMGIDLQCLLTAFRVSQPRTPAIPARHLFIVWCMWRPECMKVCQTSWIFHMGPGWAKHEIFMYKETERRQCFFISPTLAQTSEKVEAYLKPMLIRISWT